MPLTFIANREVRTFPKGWVHPRDERGRPVPLLPHDDWSRTPEGRADIIASGEQPAPPSAYMPAPEGEVEIAAYETTTEGSPISPAFPNTRSGRLALVNFCAANATTFGSHKADAEAWAAILFGEVSAAVDEAGSVTFA